MLIYIYIAETRGEAYKLQGCEAQPWAPMAGKLKESGPKPASHRSPSVVVPMIEYLMLLAPRYTYEQTRNALVAKISVVLIL